MLTLATRKRLATNIAAGNIVDVTIHYLRDGAEFVWTHETDGPYRVTVDSILGDDSTKLHDLVEKALRKRKDCTFSNTFD